MTGRTASAPLSPTGSFSWRVACLLAWMLMRFTGSKLVAIGLAGGMLLYMVIAGAITLAQPLSTARHGRLD